MAALSLAERRTMLSLAAETWTGPGGLQFSGAYSAASVDDNQVRGKRPSVSACYEDVGTLQAGDVLWRNTKGTNYTIKDVDPDGLESFTLLIIEPVQ